MNVRFATVAGGDERQVAALLPANYSVVGSADPPHEGEQPVVVIAGCDHEGWNLDHYVIPRLASGLCFATELVPKGQ